MNGTHFEILTDPLVKKAVENLSEGQTEKLFALLSGAKPSASKTKRNLGDTSSSSSETFNYYTTVNLFPDGTCRYIFEEDPHVFEGYGYLQCVGTYTESDSNLILETMIIQSFERFGVEPKVGNLKTITFTKSDGKYESQPIMHESAYLTLFNAKDKNIYNNYIF